MSPAKVRRNAPASMPTFRELSRAECDEILARNHVGRVAFTFHDHVDIEPVHYVFANGWLHGRTAPGAKLSVLRHHPWVAFAVGEVEGLFNWRSGVVRGVFDLPEADGSAQELDAYRRTRSPVRGTGAET